MLKGVSPLVSPALLKILMEMGHGDELCLADGNFPAAAIGSRVVRADGHAAGPVLDGILALLPLDDFVAKPAVLMDPGDSAQGPPDIWAEYEEIIKRHEPGFGGFGYAERFAFYERARSAYCVVATGERALYANIILKKGVIRA